MPTKKPGCEHQFESEPDCAEAWRNTYHCVECKETWTDTWSCQCNDRCPKCNAEIEPLHSAVIAECACAHLKS